jgi:hypothetical protein
MNLLVLALLAAATNTQPNTNGSSTANKNTGSAKTTVKNSKTTKNAPAPADGTVADPNAPQDGQTPAPAKKKKGAEAAEAPADGSPASIVGNSVDAATQIANEAAKAAMEEVKRLQAIGGGSTGGSPVDGKLVEAGVAGTAAVAKEVTKAQKKKPAAEETSSDEPAPKPAKKKADQPTDNSGDGKVFGTKIEGAPKKPQKE